MHPYWVVEATMCLLGFTTSRDCAEDVRILALHEKRKLLGGPAPLLACTDVNADKYTILLDSSYTFEQHQDTTKSGAAIERAMIERPESYNWWAEEWTIRYALKQDLVSRKTLESIRQDIGVLYVSCTRDGWPPRDSSSSDDEYICTDWPAEYPDESWFPQGRIALEEIVIQDSDLAAYHDEDDDIA